MEGRTTLQAFKLRRACVASAIVVGSEFLVGRMAESTKGVEENDKGSEGKRGDIGARGETWNGGRKQDEEEDDNAKEEGEERAAKGKSQATCTRQQPPTSEELIINLLSPSPNAAVLTRPPSLHFHLRLSLAYHPLSRPLCRPLHSHLSFLPRSLPFPFIQSFPPFSLFSLLLPSSSPTLRRVACLRLRLLALSLSPLSLRGLAFDLASVLSTSKPCRYFRSI